jgi:hypothetical protein
MTITSSHLQVFKGKLHQTPDPDDIHPPYADSNLPEVLILPSTPLLAIALGLLIMCQSNAYTHITDDRDVDDVDPTPTKPTTRSFGRSKPFCPFISLFGFGLGLWYSSPESSPFSSLPSFISSLHGLAWWIGTTLYVRVLTVRIYIVRMARVGSAHSTPTLFRLGSGAGNAIVVDRGLHDPLLSFPSLATDALYMLALSMYACAFYLLRNTYSCIARTSSRSELADIAGLGRIANIGVGWEWMLHQYHPTAPKTKEKLKPLNGGVLGSIRDSRMRAPRRAVLMVVVWVLVVPMMMMASVVLALVVMEVMAMTMLILFY